ncbi:polycystin family receptor for egg jelly-like isoform X3 [Apostichopus japonicus]
MRTNTNEEKCKEQHSSVTRGVSCMHPGRYSFAKRACVGEPSEPDLQIPSDHTHESFSSSFPSVGSQRVYFDEPILLKKGDILGVSVIKGRIAATVNDENPDCVLSVDSTLCSNQGIEARARFMVLGSSKVMVKALTPPDVTEDITVEWHFENDLGTAQVEGTLEYLQPVENIEITGEDTPLVSEGQEYRVNFTGHADSIHWSFGDGEELKTDGCSTNVTKAWWWPGTYNLTVTVSNRISTMEFTKTIRVGLLPAIDFYVWTYEVPRGELAVLGFENGLVNKDGVFSSQRDEFMVCYVSSSITGHTSINMTSASGPNIWVPTSNLYDQYIKFYYQELSYISGIKTAGHPELEQWVEEFKLYYHIRWGIWKPLLKLDGSDTFLGNFDSNTVVEHSFPTHYTDGIKLIPTKWRNHISVRMEVQGIYQGDVQNDLEIGYDTVVSISDNAPVAFREMFDAWGTDLRNISMTKNGSVGTVSFYTDVPDTIYFTVRAHNDWGQESFGINVQFADPIVHSGQLFAESLYSFEESVPMVLRLDSGDLVTVEGVTLDGLSASSVCTNWDPHRKSLNCTFVPGTDFHSVGEHHVSVVLENRISGLVEINGSFTVVEAVEGLSLQLSEEYLDIGQEVQISYSLLRGTNVTVMLRVGSDTHGYYHACASCEPTERVVVESFRVTGNVSVTVTAWNALNSLEVTSHTLVAGNVEVISHSYESLVEKLPIESASAPVEFAFTDDPSEVPYEVIIFCHSYPAIHTYVTQFEPVVTLNLFFSETGRQSVTCDIRNPISSKTVEMTFEIEERISGLNMSVHPRNITMLESVFLNTSVVNGSRVYFEVDWGDGESKVFSPLTLPTDLEHVYRRWGTFLIRVTPMNELGESEPAYATIKVATPEDGCVLFRDTYHVPLPAGDESVSFSVDLLMPANLSVPNLAEYSLFLDGQFYLGGVLSPTDSEGDGEPLTFVRSFDVRKESAGSLHVTVEVKKTSENYFQTCYWDAHVVETVSGVSSAVFFSESPHLDVDVANSSWKPVALNPSGRGSVITHSTVKVWIDATFGSMRSYLWDFDLSGSEDSTCRAGLNEEEGVCYFWLSQERNFTFSVNVTNPVSHFVARQGFSILEPVGSIVIRGPSYIVRVLKNVAFSVEISSLGSESCYSFLMEQISGDLEVEAYFGDPILCDMLFPDGSPERMKMEDIFGYSISSEEGRTTLSFVHNFTVVDRYHLSVVGKNLVSETDSHLYQDVLEPACYQPNVDVASENVCDDNFNCNQDNTTKLFSASDVVTISSRVRLNCSSSYKALYSWTLYLLQDDGMELEYILPPEQVVTSGYTLGTLTIPPAMLRYGTYRIQLNVTMEEAEQATNYDSTFIQVDVSSLIAKISGGDSRTIPWGTLSVLDGLSASYDPNVGESDKSGLTFFWFCRRKTYRPPGGPAIENVETFETWSYDFTTRLSESTVNPAAVGITEADVGGCFGRYGEEGSPSPGGLLRSHDGILQLPTNSMFENMEYEFKVVIRSGDFQAEDYQSWSVLSENIPVVAIRCLENCAERINPTDRLAMEAFLDSTSTRFPYFRWELLQIFENGSDYLIPESIWTSHSTTGQSSPAVTVLPGVFQEGETFSMVMYSAWSKDFLDPAVATYTIEVNGRPVPGSCGITSYEGSALVDQFSVFCFGWEDIDVPLTYTFKERPVGTSDWRIFHSDTKAFMEPTSFQAGLEKQNYSVEIQITVHDKLGACTTADPIVIKVLPGPLPQSNEAAGLVQDLQIEFFETASNGETGLATNIAINIIEVLNEESRVEMELAATPDSGQPSVSDPDDFVDYPLNLDIRITIRTEVVSWLAESEIPTVEGIEQSATAVAEAIAVPAEVSEEAQDIAINIAINYADRLQDLSKVESTVDDSLKSATNTVLKLADNIVTAALTKLNTSMVTIEEVTNFDIYEEDYDAALLEPEEENKDVLTQAETTISKSNSAVQKCQEVVSQIQTVLEQTLVADESPTVVETPGITVACAKTRPLSNTTDVTMMQINENCSFTLPMVDSFVRDGFNVSSATVWVVDMALFGYNMRPSDVKSSVSSESLSVKMRDVDSGEALKMRNLSDTFQLTLPQRSDYIEKNLERSRTYSNQSNPKGGAMAVHTIYVPWSNALSLHFEAGAFQEMELDVVYNFTFHVLVKQDSPPSFFDYDLECDLVQQLWLTEEPPRNRKRTDRFKVSMSGETECFFDNDQLDLLRTNRSSVNFRVGVSHTFIGSEPARESEDAATSLSMTSILYKLRPQLSKCFFSSETGKKWKSVGCKVLPTSSMLKTDCACNHLTLFGGGFSIPINSIDLSDSAFTKLDENPVVFAFLLACLCVYAVIVVWARKKDKRDLEKTGVTPLPDNDPRDKFMFEVTVFTGFKGKAGTTAKVSINITGDRRETGPRPFLDKKRKVFQQGGVDSFLLSTPESLGELQFLHVWHDNSGSDASWFLSRVSVKDLRTEKVYYFIVDQWLAVEEDDGKIERVCPVAGKSELTAFGFLFYSKSRKNLSDGHLWFSIFARPYKSSFTRVQRTTCCLSLLFTTMMANIFFYNVDMVDGHQTELFKVGPLTFTIGEIIIGCISGLMVFPINLIVVNIFRSVKPPPKSTGLRRWIKRKFKRNGVSTMYARGGRPLSSMTEHRSDSSMSNRPLTASSINGWMNNGDDDDDFLAENELERERDLLEGKVHMPVYSISGNNDGLNPLRDSKMDEAAGGDHRLHYEPVAGFKRTAKRKKKKRFLLPWYFVYLGWVLVVLSVAVSFWLTIEVAGQFGREKSMEWLLSIGISLAQDIFLAQPIKVLLLALFFSLIIKKPEEEEENANDLGMPHLGDDEEYLHQRMTLEELNDPSKLAFLSEMKQMRAELADLPNMDDLEQSRSLRMKEIKMRKILTEIIFYIIFLNVIMIISFGDRDFNSYWINRSMSNMFVDARYHGRMKFNMVKNRTGFWNWTDHTLIPSLHSLSWYNGDPDLPGRGQHQVADQTMSMIGTPRFRQVRVKKGYCSVPGAMGKTVDECKDQYSIAGNDDGYYNESWELPLKDPGKLNFHSFPNSVWAYQDWIKLKSIPYPGYQAMYDGGGYIAQLGKTPRESWRVTRYLKENKWIDQYTRAVFIEFVVYNPAVNLFCASFLIMEFLPQGGASSYVYFIPMKLDRYHSSVAYFILAGEIVYLCFILYFLFREFYNIRKERAAYFKSMWNILEVCTISLALLGLFCYVYQMILSRDLLVQYRDQPNQFLNFQYVSTWAEFHNWFVSGVLFIATLKFLRLLRFNRRLQLLALTFKGSGKEITAYTVVFGIVFMAYASAAYNLFQVGLWDFSTLVRTVESLFATIMGKFDFYEMNRYQPIFGPLFFFSFVMIMIFILMSMFLSIINAAFKKVRIDNEMEGNELEMVNFIMSRFLTWTGFSKRRVEKGVKAKTKYIEGIDPVTQDCEELRTKLDDMIGRLQTFVVQERREAFGLRGDEGKARRIFIS